MWSYSGSSSVIHAPPNTEIRGGTGRRSASSASSTGSAPGRIRPSGEAACQPSSSLTRAGLLVASAKNVASSSKPFGWAPAT
jgi:hypothetical protein